MNAKDIDIMRQEDEDLAGIMGGSFHFEDEPKKTPVAQQKAAPAQHAMDAQIEALGEEDFMVDKLKACAKAGGAAMAFGLLAWYLHLGGHIDAAVMVGCLMVSTALISATVGKWVMK